MPDKAEIGAKLLESLTQTIEAYNDYHADSSSIASLFDLQLLEQEKFFETLKSEKDPYFHIISDALSDSEYSNQKIFVINETTGSVISYGGPFVDDDEKTHFFKMGDSGTLEACTFPVTITAGNVTEEAIKAKAMSSDVIMNTAFIKPVDTSSASLSHSVGFVSGVAEAAAGPGVTLASGAGGLDPGLSSTLEALLQSLNTAYPSTTVESDE